MGAASSVPNNPPSPPTEAPLTEVVVNNGNRNAKPPTPSVVPPIKGSAPTAVVVNPRRGEYVALGGSRKSGKGRKKAKSKKSKKSSKAKSSKSRK